LIDTAIILAIGNPLHQSQLIYNRPRAMLPALGKPLVVRTMERLFRAGIRKYIVVIGENEGAVASYLNSQWLPNVEIQFILQSINISLIQTLIEITQSNPQPFVITTYNTFTHNNFPEQILKQYTHSPVDLLLTIAPSTLSRSNTHTLATIKDQQIVSITDRQPKSEESYVTGNLVVCGIKFIEYLNKSLPSTGQFNKQLIDIFATYLQNGGKISVAETTWLLQIETDSDLLTLNWQLLDDDADSHILSELPPSVHIIPPVRIDPQVSVGLSAQLGPRVYLESGCSIGHHANIGNAIILQNTIIPANSRITNAIIATRARIDYPSEPK